MSKILFLGTRSSRPLYLSVIILKKVLGVLKVPLFFKKSILQFIQPTSNSTFNYHYHCPFFSDERSIFLNNIRSFDENVSSGSDSRISETLLFDVSSFKDTKNASILNIAIDYILSTERFDVPLTNF